MNKILFLCLTLLLTATSLWCQYEKLLSDTDTLYKSANTFEADILQTVAISYADMQIESIGKMYLANGTFALEYTSPKYQFITYVDGVVTLYMQDENSALITNIPEGAKSDLLNPADLFNSDISAYTFIQEEDGQVVFKVSDPETPQADVKLYINKSNNQLVKIESDLGTGEFTSIVLRNQKFNQPLSKSPSSFKVPEGAAIITY